MAKPYSIQSPEDIAKQYAGNKQKIGEAMQMGIIDPTAGVLAGMFIDRMRGAQAQEGANPPTVAQQVMGGLPPTPPAPLPLTGELGAAPQGAPPMAPEMPMMPEAPMGMAAGGTTYEPPYAKGGLSDVPIPDTMFDEPGNGGFNDGYAGGGIVAFGPGGSTSSWGTYIEEKVRELDPNIYIAGRGRTPSRNAQVGGVANSYHLIDAARDIRTPEGMDKNEFIAQLKSVFGPDYDVLPSKGSSVHVEPGPALGEKVRAGAAPSNAPAVTPERDTMSAAGRMGSLEDILASVQGINRKSDEELEAEKRVRAKLEERASDEGYEKQRKADMWQTLAEIGFNMASSKSPYVLQAIGEAAAAAMPGARADKKERKEAKDRALEGLMELGASSRREAMDALKVAIPVWQAGMSAEEFERSMKLKQDELNIMRDYRRDSLAIEEYKAKHPRSTTTEYMVEQYMSEFGGTPMNALAQLKKLGLIGGQGQSGGGESLEELLKKPGSGGAGAGTGGFTVTRE